jgi:hypothetical protein
MTTPKKLALILGWLMLPIATLTQTTNSGNVVSVGQASHGGVGGGGAPLTYSARTDLCVTGSETGCTGLGLSFQMRTTDAVPLASYPNAPTNAAATDPDFHSYLVMATDWTTSNRINSWMVNNGGQATFNLDSTMLHLVQNGSADKILLLNPAAIHAHQAGTCVNCVAPTSIVSGSVEPSCGNNCTKLDNGGITIWSVVPGETNVLYELAADNVTVNRLVVQTAGTPASDCTMTTPLACTFSRTPYVQFTSDSPVPCSAWGAKSSVVHSGWNGVVNVAFDGSVSLSMDGAPDWQPSTAYVATEDIILPQTNNGTKVHAFQAATSGTSVSQPNWNVVCPSIGQTCSDGGVTWTNIGQSTGQGHAFNIVNYDIHRGCSRLNTLTGKVYRGTNEGSAYPSPGTPDASGDWLTDDNYICERYGINYPNTCTLPDRIRLHEGGSYPDSRFVAIGPSKGSVVGGCEIPGNCSCIAATATYRHGWSATTDYKSSTKDTVFDPTGNPPSVYVALTNSGPSYGGPQAPASSPAYWGLADQECTTYIWQAQTAIVRPCMTGGLGSGPQCDGHGVKGYVNLFVGTANGGTVPHLLSRLSVNGGANPGIPTTVPSQGLPGAHHESYLNSGTTDQTPIGLIMTDVPTSTYTIGGNPPGSSPANLPWYAELLGVAVDGSNTVYRFAHVYNTGSNPNFNAQNNVGAISEDGQFMAVTTDMMGTRGSISADWQANHAYTLGATMFPTAGNPGNYDFQATVAGTSSATEPSSWCQTASCTTVDGGVTWTNLGASCNQLRAMYSPATNTAFSLSDTVFPTNSNVDYDLFKATQAGTTGGTLPTWSSSCGSYGQTCTDGGVIWTNIGPNDCRFDAMIVDLLSAH